MLAQEGELFDRQVETQPYPDYVNDCSQTLFLCLQSKGIHRDQTEISLCSSYFPVICQIMKRILKTLSIHCLYCIH